MASRAVYNAIQNLVGRMPSRVKRAVAALEPVLPKPEYYLISYPKSGRTWLRMMIGSSAIHHLGLAARDPTDLESFSRQTRRFPTIRITHDASAYKVGLDKIRFRAAVYASSRIIFLVRDPRDVLVSLFYDQKYRRVFEPDLPEFEVPDDAVDAEIGGLRSLIRFLNVWAENLGATQGYMVTHYEDIKADPEREIRRCLDFLELDHVSVESIAAGVEKGRFERMQEAERKGAFSHPRLRAADPTNTSSFKVRKGVVGGYLEEFSPDAIRRMEALIEAELSDLFARYKYRTDLNGAAGRAAAAPAG